MSQAALTLLHAPSTYDFRRMTILRGPISDLVPSSSIFEMYPIGFTSIANHLENAGYPVRIVNIAARMLLDNNFDVEGFICALSAPLIFGLDLHWLPHAHGAIELAKIVKHYHPNTPILLGGFSASYFHQEIMQNHPQIDFILRGDSTEDALRQLLEVYSAQGNFATVPNLTWRAKNGTVQVNPLTNQPLTIDSVSYDFRRLMVSSMRDRDFLSYMPFQGWLNYPIMPAVSCRGCTLNCVGCGGSASAYRLLHGRSSPVYRSAEKLAEDIWRIASISNAPVFIIGDIRQAGADYADAFLDALKGIKTPLIMEFFLPTTAEFMQKVAQAIPNYAVEFSIESHDHVVRHAYGKPYSNEAIEQTIEHVLNHNAQRLDLFFMTGLPQQSYQSVLESADYADFLLGCFGADKRLRPFIGPMAPFIDPASRGFEQPQKHGYRLFYHTFEEHRQALLEPSWQFTLNYETNWMTRHDIVHSTYDACIRFAELKAKYGLIPTHDANVVISTLQQGKLLAQEIEQARRTNDLARIEALRPRIQAVNNQQGTEEDEELRLPSQRATFKWLHLLWLLLKSWWASFWQRSKVIRSH